MQIVVHTKFTLKEYRRLLRTYYSSLTAFKIGLIVGILFLSFAFVTLFEFGFGISKIGAVLPVLVMGLASTFASRLLAFYLAGKIYNGSKIHEKIIYRIDEKRFDVQGESFNTTTEWEKMYKVQELNEWFLVFPSKIYFNALPKKDFQFGDIENFRDQLKGMSWLKLKLKG